MYKIFELTEQGTLVEPTHREKITAGVYRRPEPTFGHYNTPKKAREAIEKATKNSTANGYYYILERFTAGE